MTEMLDVIYQYVIPGSLAVILMLLFIRCMIEIAKETKKTKKTIKTEQENTMPQSCFCQVKTAEMEDKMEEMAYLGYQYKEMLLGEDEDTVVLVFEKLA